MHATRDEKAAGSGEEAMSYRPTFVATVTPNEIDSGETASGASYATLKDARISRKGKEDIFRTIMAFGPAAGIAAALEKGAPVSLAVQNNGATLKLVGLPRAA
jgi:hypothetical protein